MHTSKTATDSDLGWITAEGEALPAIPHLVIAWSREEPHRIGEAAPIAQPCVLGRGGPQRSDPAPRVVFYRQRPAGAVEMPPLSGSRISRLQLQLAPIAGGLVSVSSVGRSTLLVNDEVTSSAVVRAGDTVALRNALVLLVTSRRPSSLSLRSYPEALSGFPFGGADTHGIVGESHAVWELRETLAAAGEAQSHVLLQGESGVGKELAARAIHALSARRDRVFVSRNAATFPEQLVDAELFGTAKGYPNVGTPERPGLVGEADGGTLFLDEIGELPQHLQTHLLRVLDRGGEYQRLGEPRSRRSNLRLVGATNRPIDALKHDFAARFTVRVGIPGLSARREDIPLLIRHLLHAAAQANPGATKRLFEPSEGAFGEPRIDPRLIGGLLRHRYTSHLRELERLLWISLTTSPNNFLALTPELEAELQKAPPLDGGAKVERAAAAPPPDQAAEGGGMGRADIESALADAGGSIKQAAHRLGLKNRYALYRLMKRHGITVPEEPGDP